MISDSELEIRKFKMFADKADSEAKVIELCKKYLAHKGVDVDKIADQWAIKSLEPAKVETKYIGPGIKMYRLVKIDRMELQQGYPPEILAEARAKAAQQLLRDLLEEGYVKFHSQENYNEDRTEIIAQIHVTKDP
jgi:hypothetical protein